MNLAITGIVVMEFGLMESSVMMVMLSVEMGVLTV